MSSRLLLSTLRVLSCLVQTLEMNASSRHTDNSMQSQLSVYAASQLTCGSYSPFAVTTTWRPSSSPLFNTERSEGEKSCPACTIIIYICTADAQICNDPSHVHSPCMADRSFLLLQLDTYAFKCILEPLSNIGHLSGLPTVF